MKRRLLLIPVLCLLFVHSNGQSEAARLTKAANDALSLYKLAPKNTAKLEEARMKIDQALKTTDGAGSSLAWITRGDIYTARIQKDVYTDVTELGEKLTGDNDALVAYEAYKKGNDLSDKLYEKNKAITGIAALQSLLVHVGLIRYNAKDPEKAYQSFRAALESHDILHEQHKKSMFDAQEDMDDQLLMTAVAASEANRCREAIPFYKKLYDKGNANATVYEGLYNCYTSLQDETTANRILAEGRKKYPDETSLLFAQINAYLKAGRLQDLPALLKQSIQREPGNIALYTTLGNVYDKLYQDIASGKDQVKANEYFNEAKKYYSLALEKDPQNFDANYSLGALYYNKAAMLTAMVNGQPGGATTTAIKAGETELMSLFDMALPYFKRAEHTDPNDISTLSALVEIHNRKQDQATAAAIKKRLDLVKGGGKNKSPYFQ